MKTTTSIKLDKDIKDQASALANELGLSLSSVINATLKKFVNERRVVLSVSPEFNKKTEGNFLKIRDDIKKNKNLSKAYTNSKELFKALEI
jgi:addiction module RelB/DinJ family antitoxin